MHLAGTAPWKQTRPFKNHGDDGANAKVHIQGRQKEKTSDSDETNKLGQKMQQIRFVQTEFPELWGFHASLHSAHLRKQVKR